MSVTRNTQKILVIIGFIIGLLFLFVPSRSQEVLADNLLSVHPKDEVTVSVYPNPTTSFLRVKVDLNGYDGMNLKVTSLEGKILISERLKSSGVYPIRMSMLNAGTYLLKVQSYDGTYSETIRVTKQ